VYYLFFSQDGGSHMKMFNKLIGIAAVVIFSALAVDCNAMDKSAKPGAKDAKEVDFFAEVKTAENLTTKFKSIVEAAQETFTAPKGGQMMLKFITQMNTKISELNETLTSKDITGLSKIVAEFKETNPRFVTLATGALTVFFAKLQALEKEAEAAEQKQLVVVQAIHKTLATYATRRDGLTNGAKQIRNELARTQGDIQALEEEATEAVNTKLSGDKALIAVETARLGTLVKASQLKLGTLQEKIDGLFTA